MTDEAEVFFQTNVTKDGKWPYKWQWEVVKEVRTYKYCSDWQFRMGCCSTRRGARRKALRARIKMENDDL